jgi:hypothetical protein
MEIGGRRTEHRQRRTRAGVPRGQWMGESRSVRAGTNQATSEGARAGKAARRTKCQAGTQRWARSASATTRVGSADISGIRSCKQIKQAHANSEGAGTLIASLVGFDTSDSTTRQPSCEQAVPEPLQHTAAVPCEPSIEKNPAASNPQCCVAGNQSARRTTAMK